MVFRRPRFIAVALLAGTGALFADLRTAAAQAPARTGEPPAQPGSTGQAPSQPAPAAPRAGASGTYSAEASENLIPQDTTPATAAGAGTAPPVDPASDQAKLLKQGAERPDDDGDVGARPSDVFAEDWWTQARPVFEIHGYYRRRRALPQLRARPPRHRRGEATLAAAADNDYQPPGTALKHRSFCGPDRR